MSILIKGVEMPKEPWECPCHNGENGGCNVTNNICFEIPKDCPLVEIQTPHEDLIDKNKMTRDEAIDILRCRKDGNAVEALEMAIRSLEAWDKVDYLVNKTYWGFPIGIDYCLDMLTEIMKEVEDDKG